MSFHNISIYFFFSANGSAITSYPPNAANVTNIAFITVSAMPSIPSPLLANINVRTNAIIKAYILIA